MNSSFPPNGRKRAREYGIRIGVLPTGENNAITDVEGVLVGHVTLNDERIGMHTGVTAIRPHPGNVFQEKVPCGVFLGNGFGKMTGYAQVKELGNLETPIILTNTMSIAAAIDGLIDWTFEYEENEDVMSVNCFVGETNDSGVNDIRARFVQKAHVLSALKHAASGPVVEGAVGAGTGTKAFGFKAGIGTASRKLPDSLGGWTVGALVQANFGGILTIDGEALGLELGGYPYEKPIEAALANAMENADGSIMMIVATDAPLDARGLERLAKRAFMGMTRTGGVASNGSGDFAVAFSTAESVRVKHKAPEFSLEGGKLVRNDDMTPLFMAAIEATEEAILNSLFLAHDMTGSDGKFVRAMPLEPVLARLRAAGKLHAD
ncbi:P1 family peptidase [Sutterella massiliensis]|uniref:P1 family peptidase n=1 Tax=Sutterella massiliensis TaxID=1816689 RepID=A0ABS2DSU2_9BURK|nr:P1 family peptidase [Sutterella massiliensis]MBM6704374.1 P1 family peptidase [Sutterella massiliensis]